MMMATWKRDVTGMIDVTKLDLRQLVRSAFDHSQPQGLGFIHHQPGAITDAELNSIIGPEDSNVAASADYTRGRSMKLHIYRQDGRLYWARGWYDHSAEQQAAVLSDCGMPEACSIVMVEV
jgi:hypothetical protein